MIRIDRRLWILLLALITSTAVAAPPVAGKATQPNRPALVVRNTFKTPEEVLRHYCERDSWGYIWSGWAKAEREALSLWKSSPLPEVIYVIKDYEILPAQITDKVARIEVIYHVIVKTDAHATLIEKGPKDKRVFYKLKLIDGHWKIKSPSPLEQPAFIRNDRYAVKLPKGIQAR